MRTPLDQALERLHASQRPLLIAHPRPDGDTIGSTLALRLALLSLGKAPRVACVHPLPENLAYLPGAATFEADVPEDADIDLVVAVDMSDLSRTGASISPNGRAATRCWSLIITKRTARLATSISSRRRLPRPPSPWHG